MPPHREVREGRRAHELAAKIPPKKQDMRLLRSAPQDTTHAGSPEASSAKNQKNQVLTQTFCAQAGLLFPHTHTTSAPTACMYYVVGMTIRIPREQKKCQPKTSSILMLWVRPYLPLEEAVRAQLARHGQRDGLGDVRPGPKDRYAHHLHFVPSSLFAFCVVSLIDRWRDVDFASYCSLLLPAGGVQRSLAWQITQRSRTFLVPLV